jgi:hypothetical protein
MTATVYSIHRRGVMGEVQFAFTMGILLAVAFRDKPQIAEGCED